MRSVRALVCCAAFGVALMPLAAFADEGDTHAQNELINAEAQYTQAQQTAADMQAQAQASATNERMIALLKSEALRERQLDLVTNADAMEQLAIDLANATRAQGNVDANNEFAIAQAHAATLVANVDANVANAQMLAETKGRWDELFNAKAQSTLLHQIADFISGQQAQVNMANAHAIADQQANAIQGPAMAEQQNGAAMGANSLLAADVVFSAGTLNARSVTVSADSKASNVVSHAAASLANAKAMAHVQ
jgi:hypothetical protein